MSLTKKDKEEIKALIKEALSSGQNTVKEHSGYTTNCSYEWTKEGYYSKYLDATLAPENLVVTLPDGTEKKYFTFDEAIKYTKDLPDGWRLPTRSEWCILAEEFGNNPDTGKLDSTLLMKTLNLSLDGYMNGGVVINQASNGYLWSGTTYSGIYAYLLGYSSSYVNPADVGSRQNGFPVRCVRKKKGK